eukprot:2843582-Amphidinium_carterae.2
MEPRPDNPGLIQSLRLTSNRNGVKILLMGHIQTRGREFALHTIQEPDTSAYLQEYVSDRVPELKHRPFALAVVEGRSSPWHTDGNSEVYIANPLSTPGVTLQVEGHEDIVLGRTFVAFNGMRKHRVLSDTLRRLLVAYVPAQLKSGARHEISFLVQGTLTRPSLRYHKLWMSAQAYTHSSIGVPLRTLANWVLESQHGFPLPELWQARATFLRRHHNRWLSCQLGAGNMLLHDDKERLLERRGLPTPPMPSYHGGGGGAPPNDGAQIKRIRDIDCRFTVYQARMLLSSTRVARAANSGDYWALRQAIEVEHERLNLWPKCKTTESPKKEQPPSRDKEPAQISLQDDQITVRGQPVPVRAALRQDCSGVQLVNTAEEA